MKRLLLLALLAGCNQRTLGSTPSAAEPLCQFDAPVDGERAVLAAVVDRQLVLIHADGSHTAPYVFGAGGAANVFGQTVAARGGRIAAAVSWVADPSGQGDWHEEVVLLDADGTVRYHADQVAPGGAQLFLSESGALAAAFGADGLVIDSNGHARALPGVAPLGEPADDGTVAVRGPWTGEQPGPVGWSTPGADSPRPLRYPLADPASTPLMVAGQLVYLALDGGAPVLVSESPDRARTVPLPGIDAGAGVADHVESGWVLVGDFRTPSYRVNVKTLELHPIGQRSADGLRPFSGALYGPRLDDDGALLMSLRDDYSGALYRSAEGTAWSRIGGTFTNVLDVDVAARGGSYLINGTNGRYSVEEWTPAPPGDTPDFDGDSLEIARPQAGVARPLKLGQMWVEVQSLSLSSDGRCLAYWDVSADGMQTTLTAYDVERGRSFPLESVAYSTAVAWVE